MAADDNATVPLGHDNEAELTQLRATIAKIEDRTEHALWILEHFGIVLIDGTVQK